MEKSHFQYLAIKLCLKYLTVTTFLLTISIGQKKWKQKYFTLIRNSPENFTKACTRLLHCFKKDKENLRAFFSAISNQRERKRRLLSSFAQNSYKWVTLNKFHKFF